MLRLLCSWAVVALDLTTYASVGDDRVLGEHGELQEASRQPKLQLRSFANDENDASLETLDARHGTRSRALWGPGEPERPWSPQVKPSECTWLVDTAVIIDQTQLSKSTRPGPHLVPDQAAEECCADENCTGFMVTSFEINRSSTETPTDVHYTSRANFLTREPNSSEFVHGGDCAPSGCSAISTYRKVTWDSPRCASYADWPKESFEFFCSDCQALINLSGAARRCDQFCESFGHKCVVAASSINGSCHIKQEINCSTVLSESLRMVCTCHYE